MMVVKSLVGALAFVFVAYTSANADPVSNVSDWAQRFTELARQSDLNGLEQLVTAALDARVAKTGIHEMLDSLNKVAPKGKVVYAEQFANKDLGTFFKRINVAVMAEDGAIFYAFTFERKPAGWFAVQFFGGSNVNSIINLDWPKNG